MYLILAIIAVIALYIVFIYNGLVRSRQIAEEAWSGIDVQLKRRADLIPNLIETVKGYAAHEKSTLEEVVSLRNKAQAVPSGDVAGRAQAEGLLGQALGRVIALAEAIPISRPTRISPNCRLRWKPWKANYRWRGVITTARPAT